MEEICRPKGHAIGEELVKFIPNFCDALFEILDHYPDYDSLVFDALVSFFSCLLTFNEVLVERFIRCAK